MQPCNTSKSPYSLPIKDTAFYVDPAAVRGASLVWYGALRSGRITLVTWL